MLHKLLFVALVATIAAGCTLNTQESTNGTSGNERSLSVTVPAGATQLRVDTTATGQAGTPDVTVLVKDDAGTILGTHTFAVSGTTSDALTVNVSGQGHVTVIAKVVDGDASLDVRVTAFVPGQPEVIVVRQTIVITQTTTGTTTTPTTSTTTPPPTTTTTTPTVTPTPTLTAPTNGTTNNSTNVTG